MNNVQNGEGQGLSGVEGVRSGGRSKPRLLALGVKGMRDVAMRGGQGVKGVRNVRCVGTVRDVEASQGCEAWGGVGDGGGLM